MKAMRSLMPPTFSQSPCWLLYLALSSCSPFFIRRRAPIHQPLLPCPWWGKWGTQELIRDPQALQITGMSESSGPPTLSNQLGQQGCVRGLKPRRGFPKHDLAPTSLPQTARTLSSCVSLLGRTDDISIPCPEKNSRQVKVPQNPGLLLLQICPSFIRTPQFPFQELSMPNLAKNDHNEVQILSHLSCTDRETTGNGWVLKEKLVNIVELFRDGLGAGALNAVLIRVPLHTYFLYRYVILAFGE